jgi:hypothetical protein
VDQKQRIRQNWPLPGRVMKTHRASQQTLKQLLDLLVHLKRSAQTLADHQTNQVKTSLDTQYKKHRL